MAPVPTILLVDDDPMVLRAMARALTILDVRVVAVDRAFGLLNRVAELSPAVVVLDVHMPGLDGASLVQLIRDDPTIRHTRVLLFSGLHPDTLAQLARGCGADGWIPKEGGAAGVITAIRRILPTVATANAAVSRRLTPGERARLADPPAEVRRRATLRGMPAVRSTLARHG